MNRRHFLRSVAAVSAVGLAEIAPWQAVSARASEVDNFVRGPAIKDHPLRQLSKHVWMIYSPDGFPTPENQGMMCNLTFIDTDWRHLDKDFDGIQFIRVSGNALAEEAEAAINAVNSLRKRSTALVISNAVRVEGLAEMDKLASLTLEDVSGFDVLGALCAGWEKLL